jgi:hypothetical protein
MDAFDWFWQWADKPIESPLTIPAELHRTVMALAPDERRDRELNQAVAIVANADAKDSCFPAGSDATRLQGLRLKRCFRERIRATAVSPDTSHGQRTAV